jgi:hypothetical protein
LIVVRQFHGFGLSRFWHQHLTLLHAKPCFDHSRICICWIWIEGLLIGIDGIFVSPQHVQRTGSAVLSINVRRICHCSSIIAVDGIFIFAEEIECMAFVTSWGQSIANPAR